MISLPIGAYLDLHDINYRNVLMTVVVVQIEWKIVILTSISS